MGVLKGFRVQIAQLIPPRYKALKLIKILPKSTETLLQGPKPTEIFYGYASDSIHTFNALLITTDCVLD